MNDVFENKLWFARDKATKQLHAFWGKPILSPEGNWSTLDGNYLTLPTSHYPHITYENSPMKGIFFFDDSEFRNNGENR